MHKLTPKQRRQRLQIILHEARKQVDQQAESSTLKFSNTRVALKKPKVQ